MIAARTLLIAATALLPAVAQDVGMGTRAGSGKRFEEPYTLEIETPHVKWAKPLTGGPIRLLAVPTVSEGRTLVELAQRLSLDLTTVSIDANWDINKWTMAFGDDYGARAEKGDLKLVYSYLEQELTGPKKFDAILLPINHGWQQLTPASREAIAKRVREGCGLVLVRPFASELSPLTPLDLKPENSELDEPRCREKRNRRPGGARKITTLLVPSRWRVSHSGNSRNSSTRPSPALRFSFARSRAARCWPPGTSARAEWWPSVIAIRGFPGTCQWRRAAISSIPTGSTSTPCCAGR